jgi:hypothetical protein
MYFVFIALTVAIQCYLFVTSTSNLCPGMSPQFFHGDVAAGVSRR